jgi:transposase
VLADRGAEAVIPPSSSRVRQIPYDRDAYRSRNLVERLWCRLEDWRLIATRYHKLARNFLAAALIAAALAYWTDWVRALDWRLGEVMRSFLPG